MKPVEQPCCCQGLDVLGLGHWAGKDNTDKSTLRAGSRPASSIFLLGADRAGMPAGEANPLPSERAKGGCLQQKNLKWKLTLIIWLMVFKSYYSNTGFVCSSGNSCHTKWEVFCVNIWRRPTVPLVSPHLPSIGSPSNDSLSRREHRLGSQTAQIQVPSRYWITLALTPHLNSARFVLCKAEEAWKWVSLCNS